MKARWLMLRSIYGDCQWSKKVVRCAVFPSAVGKLFALRVFARTFALVNNRANRGVLSAHALHSVDILTPQKTQTVEARLARQFFAAASIFDLD